MSDRIATATLVSPLLLYLFIFACVAARCDETTKPPEIEPLLARIEHAMSEWQDYKVKGETEANGKRQHFKVFYKAPNLVRVDARDGQVAVQPNGEIRGRMGHGIVGWISQRINRDDKRLRDDEGIPFYESQFPALVPRIRKRIKEGATATVKEEGAEYDMDIRAGETEWKYKFDKNNFTLLEDSRWQDGKQVEITHYTEFKLNTGLKTGFFKF